MLNAMSNFLTLGLSQFAEGFTADDCQYAVSWALFDGSTKAKRQGGLFQLGIEEGSLVAKWWDIIEKMTMI